MDHPIRLDARQQEVVRAATRVLDEARAQAHGPAMHRSLRRLRLTPYAALETLAIALAFTAALWWLRPMLFEGWQALIGGWSARLGVAAGASSLVPGPVTGVLTAAAVMGAFAATYWMPDRMTPLKYLVRVVCVVQATALLFFMAVPSRFPYTVDGHLQAMLASGYYLMLTLPVLLALGHSVLRVPLAEKLLAPALLLLYFALMVPHKALLHVLVLQNFSVLFMPLLYLCFGLVFDLMVFVALYSWLVSRVPDRALG
jgi:hypothetical protein